MDWKMQQTIGDKIELTEHEIAVLSLHDMGLSGADDLGIVSMLTEEYMNSIGMRNVTNVRQVRNDMGFHGTSIRFPGPSGIGPSGTGTLRYSNAIVGSISDPRPNRQPLWITVTVDDDLSFRSNVDPKLPYVMHAKTIKSYEDANFVPKLGVKERYQLTKVPIFSDSLDTPDKLLLRIKESIQSLIPTIVEAEYLIPKNEVNKNILSNIKNIIAKSFGDK
jgi:hypothetical protein